MRTPHALLFVLCVVLSAVVRAQSETMYYNRWQIRNTVSMTFTEGMPVIAQNDSFPYMDAASIFICHPLTRALQFGCGPVKIVDANGEPMPNDDGCTGTPFPKPSSSRVYYVFRLNELNSSDSCTLSYSVVDMELRQGLGDVTDQRNVPLPGTYRNTRPIGIASGDGLTHRIYFQGSAPNTLVHFVVDVNNGLVPTPVVQTVPFQAAYHMTPSPSNEKMAWYTGLGWFVTGVDPETGTLLGDAVHIPFYQLGSAFLGAFSPLGTKLYTGIAEENLFQVDLSLSTPDSVLASVTPLAQPGFYELANEPFAVETGLDGRVYTYVAPFTPAGYNMSYLAHPDAAAAACAPHWDAIPIGNSYEWHGDRWGVPMWPRLGMLSSDVPEPMLMPQPVLTVQPNPARSHVHFLLAAEGGTPVRLRIYDALGRPVLDRSWPRGAANLTVDLPELAAGKYEAAVLFTDRASAQTHLLVH